MSVQERFLYFANSDTFLLQIKQTQKITKYQGLPEIKSLFKCIFYNTKSEILCIYKLNLKIKLECFLTE